MHINLYVLFAVFSIVERNCLKENAPGILCAESIFCIKQVAQWRMRKVTVGEKE